MVMRNAVVTIGPGMSLMREAIAGAIVGAIEGEEISLAT